MASIAANPNNSAAIHRAAKFTIIGGIGREHLPSVDQTHRPSNCSSASPRPRRQELEPHLRPSTIRCNSPGSGTVKVTLHRAGRRTGRRKLTAKTAHWTTPQTRGNQTPDPTPKPSDRKDETTPLISQAVPQREIRESNAQGARGGLITQIDNRAENL